MSKDSSKKDSKPPKKNPPSGTPPKDGTEVDLWDLDADDIEVSSAPRPSESGTRDVAAIPIRRASESPVKSKKPVERAIDPPVILETSEIEEKTAPSEPTTPKKRARKSKTEVVVNPPTESMDESEPEVESLEAELEDDIYDTTEATVPAEIQPAPSFLKSLTKSEKIGIAALFAILAISATLAIVHFSTNVPTRSLITEELDLPINGELGLITVNSVDTFWREPITSGENADVVRRGTKLIPVLKISIDAKPSALRVLFRNEDGIVIGDAITRNVSGKSDLIIPATAGYDDIGMHAAYRTGESRRWIVEVLEGASSNASRDKFKKLFDTEISSDMLK